MLQDVPDWSELPYDLLVLIGRCLNLIVDYIKFCKSWHSAATKNNFNSDLPRVPWLMLAEEEDNEGNSFRRFFSLYDGMILKKRIPKASRKRCHIIAQIPFEPQGVVEHLYILESLGSLFVISRYGVRVRPIEDDCDSFPLTLRPDERELLGDGEFTYGTTDFRVFQVDLVTGKVTETEELGDMAFFLGANASLSVQASQFPGIKPNHIYFTDDCFESYLCYEEGGGRSRWQHPAALRWCFPQFVLSSYLEKEGAQPDIETQSPLLGGVTIFYLSIGKGGGYKMLSITTMLQFKCFETNSSTA
ncbi:putative plant intracellular Ras-group-related LRR protein 7-like [Capsicum annuum]|nr:putative plant intracellular Ras-group-related LRR protein 7-like [Capsicum annuum]